MYTSQPSLQAGQAEATEQSFSNSTIRPMLTYLLASRKGIGCLDRVFATHVSPWVSQAPQARYKRMWAQKREEEACCLTVLAGDLQGEMKYLCLSRLMMLKHLSKVGHDPDILPT